MSSSDNSQEKLNPQDHTEQTLAFKKNRARLGIGSQAQITAISAEVCRSISLMRGPATEIVLCGITGLKTALWGSMWDCSVINAA